MLRALDGVVDNLETFAFVDNFDGVPVDGVLDVTACSVAVLLALDGVDLDGVDLDGVVDNLETFAFAGTFDGVPVNSVSNVTAGTAVGCRMSPVSISVTET